MGRELTWLQALRAAAGFCHGSPISLPARAGYSATNWKIAGPPRLLPARRCTIEPYTRSIRARSATNERDGVRRRVVVELSETAAVSTGIDTEAERAIRTEGRSAVSKFLDEDDPPGRIVIGTNGVHAPEQ